MAQLKQIDITDLFGDVGAEKQPRCEISVSYGKINLTASSMSVAAFKISAPFVKESAIASGHRVVGRTKYFNATTQAKIGGGFTSDMVAHEVGSIILLQAARTSNRIQRSDAAIFLRLRLGAPFMAVSAVLPTGPESILGNRFMLFQGNADVMELDELKGMGLEISRGYASNYMQQDEIDENFEVRMVSTGSTPKPVLQKIIADGKVVLREMAEEAPRRMRFRR